MKNFLLAILLLPTLLFAQTGIIEGRVYDEINNEPIIGANVSIVGTTFGASTDIDGNYKIEALQAALYNIEVSYIGYETQTKFEVQVTNSKSIRLDFALKQSSNVIDSVVIKANPFERKLESPISLTSIGVNEIQRNPGGNRDISRAIKNLPGVSSGFGFRNDLLVRGGSPNENRFYLDDIEIPTINHFATQGASGGSNGLLNVDFISNADFYTGAFPANRGNAMSSVLALTQREGRKDRVGLTFTLSASDAGLTIEGPFTKKKKTTFLLNARYSYLQGLFKAFKLPFLPTYSDVQFKVMHKFNNKHDLTLVGVGAYDMLRLNTKENKTDAQKYLLRNLPYQDQWNYTIGARYRYFLKNSYMVFVLSRSFFNNHIYKHQNNDKNLPKLFDLNSNEAENKLRFEHVMRVKEYKISYGINYEYARYTTTTSNKITLGDTVLNINYSTKLKLQKYGFFAQFSKTYFDNRLSLSLGLRADGNNYNKKMANLFRQFSPRFSASYAITNFLSINFNTGLYYQLPPYTTLGFKDNSNVLVNKDRLDYIRNVQVVGGLSSTINKSNTKFSLEGFYKRYYNYPMLLNKGISLANLGGDFGVVGDEPAASISQGKTYGIEFSVQQKLWKGVYGIVSYTWFRSLFTNTLGQYNSSSWDSRHVANITVGYKFKRNWEIGIKWTIQGGLPYTPDDTTNFALVKVFDANGGVPVKDYSKLNSLRTKVIHGLNLRVDKKWFLKKINLNLYLDITNLYNAKDVSPANLDVVRDGNGSPIVANPTAPDDEKRYQLQLLKSNGSRILPTIGLVIEY
ncbi:MAG: TonB-dependent receptor [Saprospirales bacterium]|nr:TonB-dependent receptor [Saprospirales bacterium]